MYGVLNFLVRLSIALLLIRLFVVEKRWTNRVYLTLMGVIWFNGMIYTAHSISMIFACTPRAKIFNPTLPGTCINLYAFFTTTSVVNLITDTIFLVIPLYAVWGLNLPLQRKLGVAAVFAVGLL